MVLTSANQLSWSGLTLIPSTDFNFNSQLEQSASTVNSFPSTYIQRVFRFAPTSSNYNGSIRLSYLDGELNGLDENTLQLFINNGSGWLGFPASISDPAQNYLQADGISNRPLEEILLAAGTALPLKWGSASVSREGNIIRIKWTTKQEIDVSHFDIERSTNASNWHMSITGIPARNNLFESKYEATDNPGIQGRLYYRIRQTDKDGRSSLSKILVAPGEYEAAHLTITPNPAKGYFLVGTEDISGLSGIQLFSNSGKLLHTWNGGQYQYQLPSIAAGSYVLRFRFADGSYQTRKLQVR
jgi:hypothetical protein